LKTVSIQIINNSSNTLPAYETSGSAGMDIRANLEEPVKLNSLQRALIPTGLFIELPHGYEAQIRPRSGLAIKHGITCLNAPGTIDSDYRGEIKVILINLGNLPHQVQHGDRIAQLVISKVERASFDLVQELNTSQRGQGGFGHTGKN